MGDSVESVKKLLRSVLLSSKDGVKATCLQGDYQELCGSYIPHDKFGYSSLHDFLSTLHDVVRIGRNCDNELTYYAIADSSTEHIQAMVSKQKSIKKKTSKKKPSSFYRNKTSSNFHKSNKFSSNWYKQPQVRKITVSVTPSGKRYVSNFISKNKKSDSSRIVLKECGDLDNKSQKTERSVKKFVPNGSGDNFSNQRHQNKSQFEADLPPRFATKYKKENLEHTYKKRLTADEIGYNRKTIEPTSNDEILESQTMSPKYESFAPNIKSNLQQLLSVYQHGLHSLSLQSLYKETFGSEFPKLLLSKILSGEVTDYATVEKVNFGSKVKYILYAHVEDNSQKSDPSHCSDTLSDEQEGFLCSVHSHSPLKPGEDYEVTVTHFVDCDKIYVHLLSEAATLHEMTKLIKQTPFLKTCSVIRPGNYVVTDNYFRAKVLAVQNKQIEIYRIDFADSTTSYWISSDRVRPMPVEVADYPEFSIHCSMHRPSGPDRHGKWSVQSKERFCELYLNMKLIIKPVTAMTVTSVGSDTPHSEHSALFYKNNDGIKFNINARLIEEEISAQLAMINFCKPFSFQPHDYATLPHDDYCDLYVFNASCTTEVKVCVIGKGYSDQLVKLENDMLNYYSKSNSNISLPQPPPVDCVYALLSEESCVRGKLISVQGDHGNVYLIDNDDYDNVPLSQLHPLAEDFANFPVQVVAVGLAGLDHEVLSTHSKILQKLSETVVGQTCRSRIVFRFNNEQSVEKYMVELFDNSGQVDDDINQICFNMILNDDLFPTLPVSESVAAVSLANIDCEQETFYVRLVGEGLVKLNSVIAKLQKFIKNSDVLLADQLYPSKLCLAELPDGVFRARITQLPSANIDFPKVTVFLIDTGSYEQVTQDKLYGLEDEEALSVPSQAVFCKLSKVTNVSNHYQSFKDAAGSIQSKAVLLRVDQASENEDPHLVSLWLGEEEKIQIVPADFVPVVASKLISEQASTESLETEKRSVAPVTPLPSPKRKTDANRSGFISLLKSEFKSCQMLQATNLVIDIMLKETNLVSYQRTLEIDENPLAVKVEHALSPSYLQIIPLKYLPSRNILKTKVCSFYESKHSTQLESESLNILEDHLYVLHAPDENSWYRAKVLSKIDDAVSVYLLDFGECRVVQQSCLAELDTKFYKIPGFMMTAKLAGIQPDKENTLWPEEVSDRLCKLVKGNCYFAHVLKSSTDDILKGRDVWEVCLCDTTTPHDVWINDIMVNEWHCARYVS